MKSKIECIPCFFSQFIKLMEQLRLPQRERRIISQKFLHIISKNIFVKSPPEIAKLGYDILKTFIGDKDPYKRLKKKSNQIVISEYSYFKSKISKSDDKLLAAIKISIAGNIIDFGVKHGINLNKTNIFIRNRIKISSNKYFHYKEFLRTLKKTKNILYIGDNAGEIVLDKILIEEIKKLYPHQNIVFAVRGAPIINDVVLMDAKYIGLDKIVKVVDTGTNIPGVVLKYASEEFLNVYKKSDIIISKGQGNFESLEDKNKDIFYLFMVKCPVVASVLKRVEQKQGVLIYNKYMSRWN